MNLIIERLRKLLESYQSHKTIVIWGAGLLGKQIQDYITLNFPQHTIIGFVDQSISSADETNLRFPIDALSDLQPDIVIIASVAYEEEIKAQHNARCTIKNSVIVSFSADEEEFTRMAPYYTADKLAEAVFNYPESYVLWEELARRASDPILKETYTNCAKALQQ